MKRKISVFILIISITALFFSGCQNTFDPTKIKTEKDYQNMIEALQGAPEPAPVDSCDIHADGGMIYNPLSKEAKKTNNLKKYKETEKGELSQNGITLKYTVPTDIAPYDVVPVEYELSVPDGVSYPVHVEATAFEEAKRTGGKPFYDLTIPGETRLTYEFLGYVSGKSNGSRNHIEPDLSDSPAEAYPAYTAGELVKSGTLEAADYHWFRFKYTNEGDTILDSEGAGALQFMPELMKRNANGSYDMIGRPYNKFYQMLDYLYPGESREIWISFGPHADTPTMTTGLSTGEYRIMLKAIYRNPQSFPENFSRTQFGGSDMSISYFDFSVAGAAAETPVNSCVNTFNAKGQHNKWLHSFEEFMTGFDSHLKAGETRGTVYVQAASFTEQITVKLITTEPLGLAAVAIPVKVDTSKAVVKLNAKNENYTVKSDGTRFPTIVSQSMADMRGNIQLSPYPAEKIASDLLDMQSCGISLIATTAMPWLYDFMGNRVSTSQLKDNFQGDAFRFMLDAARVTGLQTEAIGNYPFTRITVGGVANWAGTDDYSLSQADPQWGVEASAWNKNLVPANAVQAIYQFLRWGDNYHIDNKGRLQFSIEDTRGWMRVDMNTRNPLGDEGKKAFAQWLADKYQTIERVNEAWGTAYTSIDKIDPEAEGVTAPNGWKYEYNSGVGFGDWTAAITDFDIFRTEQRSNNYKDFLQQVSGTAPDSGVTMRTEGANWMVAGLPSDSKNSHYRHIYYSQRRNAMIAEIMQAGQTVKSHSDYMTLPYTPSEVKELTELSVKQGITPMYLTQFDNMRDIAVNEMYGTAFDGHYNISDGASKGVFIHTLTAVFPWFDATYQGGGVPGILWQDYECDGYATETQKKEMKFFTEKLNEAMQTKDGQKWKTDFTESDRSVLQNSKAKYTYKKESVQSSVDKVKNGFNPN